MNNEKAIRIILSDNIQQFSNSEEIFEELKKLQQENLSCLDRYDTVVKNRINADKELERYRSRNQEEINLIQSDLESRELYAKRLRDRNNNLNREKNLILNPPGIKQKKSIKEEKFLATLGDNMDTLKTKIFTLYQNCYFFYTKKFILDASNVDVIKNKAILKSSSDFSAETINEMLIFNEKVFSILHERYKYLQKNSEAKLIFMEKELEKRRQLKNAQIQKEIYENKIKDIKERLARKNDNIVLPLHKVQTRIRPIEKIGRAHSISVQHKENKFIDFLKPIE